jgi:hypothetical protein
MSLNPQSPLDSSSEATAQLFDYLLASPTIDYPWNPSEPDTDDYYVESDRHFSLDDWSDREIAQRSHSFLAKIQSCWASSPTPELELSPLAALIEKFGTRVPQQWLSQIAANVDSLVDNHLEPIEQLVQSVRDLLPNWETDDLLVMARPYAYAMRGNSPVDNFSAVDWTELSELERAKLTIFIAQFAITSATKLPNSSAIPGGGTN